jgi:type IV secretion system protein VirD4
MNLERRIRIMYRNRLCLERLFYPGKAHGLLIAAARTGKFTCVLAQILFSWLFSLLMVDPKGQGCAVSWRQRRRLGQKVYRLDPFNLMEKLPGVEECPPQARIDPMKRLDPQSRTFGADADNISEALVPHDPRGESYWVNAARMLVAGVIMQYKTWWPDKTLVDVYHTIAGPELQFFALDAMPGGERWSSRPEHQFIVDRLSVAANAAPDDRHFQGVVSTAKVASQFIGNVCIADSLSASTLEPEDMTREPITVYMILPGEHLGGNTTNWFRLMAGSFVDATMRSTYRTVPVLGLLDEFKSAVGRLGVIETAMGLGAGYGLQLLPVFQNLSQLQELYPQGWETFLANAGFRIFFAPRDKTTSDYVSDMAGVSGVRGISKSISIRPDGGLSVGVGYSEQQRRCFLPHETRNNLGQDEALVLGDFPGTGGFIRAGRRPYYLPDEHGRNEWAGCYDPDPYEYMAAQEQKHGAGEEQEVFG